MNVLDLIASRGYQGRLAPLHRLPDLRAAIEDRYAQGLFDQAFYQEALNWFNFTPPAEMPGVASLLILAAPRPQTLARFTLDGKTIDLIIPPTYTRYQLIPRQIQEFLIGALTPHGRHVAPAPVPVKTLAVRSGLADYGRNNICYVAGMGSFLQLAAFYTDIPCQDDPWREPQMMARCQRCTACRQACPTDAIPIDRFLLYAERCLVYHNEHPSEMPFPEWIDPAWHNCLIGCMLCQKVCPEDKTVINWIEETEDFTHAETSHIIAGVPLTDLPAATRRKLEQIDIARYYGVLARNVGVFFKRAER